MPTLDLNDDEPAALLVAAHKAIADDRYPLSPRLAPFKSAGPVNGQPYSGP